MSCIFCAIAAGNADTTIHLEDDEFVAIADLYPKAETHVLVIPRAHHDQLDEYIATGGSGDRMLAFVARTAHELGIAGRYRLVTNVGADAGQVVGHLHWHLLAGPDLPGF